MRRVVVIDDLREFEVRPRDLFDKYIELVTKDIGVYFGNPTQMVKRTCPACQCDSHSNAFDKFGLQYVQCTSCLTVFLSPAPPEELTDSYYRDAESSKFWASHFMKDTAQTRKNRVFRPRVDWIRDIVNEYGEGPPVLVDINTKYLAYLEAVDRSRAFQTRYALNPSADVMAACGNTGFQVITGRLSELMYGAVQASVVTAFEVLERVFSTDELLGMLSSFLPERGLLLLTTLSASGFDIQTLWGDAKNIIPPTHLNLLSVEGIILLLERYGFEIIELSTPGQLDTEIVLHALEENPDIVLPRFVSYLMFNRDQEVHHDFQEFLQRHRLSSHVRVAARKK